METFLLYGRGRLVLNLPNHLEVTLIRKRAMPHMEDPSVRIQEALRSPHHAHRFDSWPGNAKRPASWSVTSPARSPMPLCCRRSSRRSSPRASGGRTS